MSTTTGAAKGRRRSLADLADDALGPPPGASAAGADATTAATSSPSPAPPHPAASSSTGDDGPRLRASAKSTLANRDVLTVRRTVYIGAEEWRAVLRLAMRRGVTASDVVRAALGAYLASAGGGDVEP